MEAGHDFYWGADNLLEKHRKHRFERIIMPSKHISQSRSVSLFYNVMIAFKKVYFSAD
jgi:hypothetical protein